MKNNSAETTKKYSHLSLEEREEIAIAVEKGKKLCEIVHLLGRSTSTISRELKRNCPPLNKVKYRAHRAQKRADGRKKQKERRKRLPNKRLQTFISKQLKQGYSPQIIAHKAKEQNCKWKTNHESIYQWIYKERNDLIPFLVRSHKKRRKRTAENKKRCPKIPNRTMIDQRPAYINLRSCIGHGEADTIISRQSKAAVMVLVERQKRFIILKKIKSKTAYEMHNALVKSLKGFPCDIRQSITYDNGSENALHEKTNALLGTTSYFCNPYHS